MSTIRPKDLPTFSGSDLPDQFVAVDSTSGGTKKVEVSDIVGTRKYRATNLTLGAGLGPDTDEDTIFITPALAGEIWAVRGYLSVSGDGSARLCLGDNTGSPDYASVGGTSFDSPPFDYRTGQNAVGNMQDFSSGFGTAFSGFIKVGSGASNLRLYFKRLTSSNALLAGSWVEFVKLS